MYIYFDIPHWMNTLINPFLIDSIPGRESISHIRTLHWYWSNYFINLIWVVSSEMKPNPFSTQTIDTYNSLFLKNANKLNHPPPVVHGMLSIDCLLKDSLRFLHGKSAPSSHIKGNKANDEIDVINKTNFHPSALQKPLNDKPNKPLKPPQRETWRYCRHPCHCYSYCNCRSSSHSHSHRSSSYCWISLKGRL